MSDGEIILILWILFTTGFIGTGIWKRKWIMEVETTKQITDTRRLEK